MKFKSKSWCQEGDLNPRPPAYETSALNQLSYLDKKIKEQDYTKNFLKNPLKLNFYYQSYFLKLMTKVGHFLVK